MKQRLVSAAWFCFAMSLAYVFVNGFVRALFWFLSTPLWAWASSGDDLPFVFK
jgi:hypothetical protein